MHAKFLIGVAAAVVATADVSAGWIGAAMVAADASAGGIGADDGAAIDDAVVVALGTDVAATAVFFGDA